MATIRPFRAWRYNPDKINNMASVLAPPYDVIGEGQHADYCVRSPYNVVHLTLGQAPLVSDAYLSRHPRAAEDLERWRKEDVLIQEQAPAVYVYEQEYDAPLEGRTKRQGCIAAVKIHDYHERVVLPHEQIRPAVKTDRLGLMRACQCTFSQIFGLFSDPKGTVDHLLNSALPRDPLFEVSDDEGIGHRMWVVNAPEVVEGIAAVMANKQIIIADGHHRYQAALNYRDQMRDTHGSWPEAPCEYTTMFLCNWETQPLTILPSHRVIREVPVDSFKYFRDPGGGLFTVSHRALRGAPDERCGALAAVLREMRDLGHDNHVFGLYSGEDQIALLTLPRGAASLGNFALERSAAWRNLDLAVLHNIIIERLLGLSGRYAESQKNILFTTSAEEAIGLVDTGESALALLINPPQVQEVIEVAQAGDYMPQKGTYFYPKPLAGIAMYDLRPQPE